MTSIRVVLSLAALAAGAGAIAAVPEPSASSAPRVPRAASYVAPYAPDAEARRAMPAVGSLVATDVVPVARPVVVPARPRGVRGRPFFRTPTAAMRYLAWAYNGHHDAALRHVTTPAGRAALVAMRGYMPTVRLVSCTAVGTGAYHCAFRHSLAKHPGKEGDAEFAVAPAIAHGWYMTAIEDCGDGEEYAG